MEPPTLPPEDQNLDEWRNYALFYLADQLGSAAPKTLVNPALFPRSPLAGEGPTVLFEFTADLSGRGEEPYHVIVGKTQPNYYPAYGLSAEEAFDLHLGTRFMLVMGVALMKEISSEHSAGGSSETAYDAAVDARGIVDRVAPGATIDDLKIAASFDVDGRIHTVLRCRVAGEPAYVMGRDAPPGFSRRVDLPAQVVFRLHLGQVLRHEPEPADEAQ
jgi:hypothetical protein